MGWPILGDPIYGPRDPAERLHLLARAISVPLAKSKPPILVEAPVPSHMREALSRFTLPAAAPPGPLWDSVDEPASDSPPLRAQRNRRTP